MAALASKAKRARASAAAPAASRPAGRRGRHARAAGTTAIGPLQAKLRVNEPQDAFEREADRTADQVMGMRQPAPMQRAVKEEDTRGTLQRAAMAEDTSEPEEPVQRAKGEEDEPIQRATGEKEEPVQRATAEEEEPVQRAKGEEEEPVQRAEDEEEPLQERARTPRRPRITSQFEADLKTLRRKGGQPLPDPVRAFFEPRFGYSFGEVRVHTGPTAAALAHEANARAFTVGRHVVFGAGEYRPGAEHGLRLLAHELTHVMQQHGGLHSVQREVAAATARTEALREATPTLQSLRDAFDLDSPLTPPSIVAIVTDLLRSALQSDADAERLRPFLVDHGMAAAVVRRIESATYTLEMQSRRTANGAERRWSLTHRAQRHTFVARPRSIAGDWPAAIEGTDEQTIAVSARPGTARFSQQSLAAGLEASARPDAAAVSQPTPPVATITPEGTVPDRAPSTPTPDTASARATPPARVEEPQTARPALDRSSTPDTPAAPTAGTEEAADEGEEAAAEEPERAPAAPEEDPAFQQTLGQVRSARRTQADHRPPEEKQSEVKDAAHLPVERQEEFNDRDEHLETIDEESDKSKTREFTPDTFKTLLSASLAAIDLPDNESEAKQFKREKPLEKAKEEVRGKVKEQNETIAGPLAKEVKAAQAPPSDRETTEPVDVEEDPAGDAPPPIAGAKAAPKPRLDSEISMDAESASLDELMTSHDMTEEQLAQSNEPTFITALDTKREAQAQAAAAPGRFRERETQTLTQAQGKAAGKGGATFANMNAVRGGTFKDVFGVQNNTASKDKDDQDVVHRHFADIYSNTKIAVDKILGDLSTKVDEIFSTTVEDAKTTFEKRVEDQLDDIYGITVIDDWIFGEDTEAIEEVFRREKVAFVATMDEAIERIARLIADELNAAIRRIDEGRAEGQRFFDGLSKRQQELSQQAFTVFKGQFDVLEDTVRDKQQELADSLAQSYRENIDSLRESFDKIKEEVSRGWIGKAVDFIVSVATTIAKLAELLFSILSRIANVIGDILAHPIRFLENLAEGVKRGFGQFIENIDTYLLAGFFDWLRGSVGGPGIQLPEKFDIAGIFSLVAQVIGLSVDTFFALARKVWGKKAAEFVEKGAGAAEKGLEIYHLVREKGLAGLWDHIRETVATRVDELVTQVKEMIVYETIKKALTYIASLFIPAGAFIKAAQAIYAGLRFLMDNIDRIRDVVDAFLTSVEMAVRGQVDAIAKTIVTALRGVIVLAIDFLAKLLRLGKLDDKARKVLAAIRKPVERAMTAVLRRLRPLVIRLMKRVTRRKKKQRKGGRQLTSEQVVPQVVKLMSTPTKSAAPAAALAEKRAQAKALIKKFQPQLKKGRLKIVITDATANAVESDAAVDFDVSASPGTPGEAPVPKTDGNVEGLTGLRREFRVEGEAHSLSLTPAGSTVTAVVAPNPVHIGSWINTRKAELERANEFDAAKQSADAGIRKDLQSLGKLTYDPKQAPTEEQERSANKLLDSLVAHVKTVGFSAAEVPVPRMVVTPGFSAQKATNTIVKFLFKDPNNHRPGRETSGKESVGGAYKELARLGGSRRQWPAGHMVNATFGGLPVNSNLIPISNTVNNLMRNFDRRVAAIYEDKKPIWMRFTVKREHPEDTNQHFVSYFKAEAAEMPLQNTEYSTPSAGSETFEKSGTDLPYPGAAVTAITLNALIASGETTRDAVAPVAKRVKLPARLVRALVTRGTRVSNAAEIGDYIKELGTRGELTPGQVRNYSVELQKFGGTIDFT
jgi:hypothetical protein